MKLLADLEKHETLKFVEIRALDIAAVDLDAIGSQSAATCLTRCRRWQPKESENDPG